MATYAIGDIQGCYREFAALLEAIEFDPLTDRLWLTGDLVNRGPESLAVMRAVMALGEAAVTVLGNHDLHLLALATLGPAQRRRKDTLDEILGASDREAIITWLRHRPLFHYDRDRNFAMVHAGLLPSWSIADASAHAAEIESVLRDDHAFKAFLETMYGDEPRRWDPGLAGLARLRFMTNCLTRMRYCERDGALNLREKGAPHEVDPEVRPWFAVDGRDSHNVPIVFGHWSTLRLSAAECRTHNVYPIDTGAVWGGALTALRLEDRRLTSVPSATKLAVG